MIAERKTVKRISVIAMVLIIFSALVFPVTLNAQEKTKVKVGWFEILGFQEVDNEGKPTGYNYDYLSAIEKRSNLEFEYVYGEWEEMLDKLETGEVDILGGIAFTESRLKQYDYCSVPNGTSIIMLITNKNNIFGYNDFEKLNGIKVASVNSDYRIKAFKAYEERKGFNAELVICDSNKEAFELLDSGEVDAAIEGSFYNFSGYEIIAQFDMRPYYYITKKGANGDILAEISDAIAEIKGVNPSFENNLEEKYFINNNSLAFNVDEKKYVNEQRTIRIGINPNRYVLAYVDDKTGEYKGIEADFIKAIEDFSGLEVELVPIENCAVGNDKFIEYDLDAVIGASQLENINDHYYHIPFMTEQRQFVIRRGSTLDTNIDYAKAAITNNAYKTEEYINSEYPNWDVIKGSPEECLDAVRRGEADVTIMSKYELEYFMQMPKYNSLTILTDFSIYDDKTIAVSDEAPKELYNILEKSTAYVSDNYLREIIYQNLAETVYEYTLIDTIVENAFSAALLFIALVLAIILYQWWTYKRVKIANEAAENALSEAVRARDEAEKANTVKTDFLSRMSHDMRTPMSTVIGLSNFGIEEKRNDQDVTYFKQIKESSEYLLGLLNDILDMQKIEYGSVEMNMEVVRTREIIKDVLSIVSTGIEKKEIEFTYDINIDEEIEMVIADKLRVEQILINVISNAIKYTPRKGKIDWKIYNIKGEDGSYSIVDEIKDEGVGMSPEFLNKLFEPFTQEKNELSSGEAGSGLGLAITKNLIEIMGGEITCQSEIGKGSLFKIIIPVELATKGDFNDKITKITSYDVSVLKGRRVLICEDNDINARILQKVLNNKNLKVDRAVNGLEGVKMAKKNIYDIILMDIRMPEMDGLTAAKEIRKFDKGVPIIALSANAYKEDIEKSMVAGMNEHLAKPVSNEVLYKTLAKYL